MARQTQVFLIGQGWLAPDGVLHECEDYNHSTTAVALGHTYSELEWLGWIHVGVIDQVYIESGRPTQAQVDTLYDILYSEALNDRPRLKSLIERFLQLGADDAYPTNCYE